MWSIPRTPAPSRATSLSLVLFLPLLACDADVAEQAEVDYGKQHAARAGAALLDSRAPAAELTMLDGGVVKLGNLLGKKPVYLKFWATWCVPCLQQMDHLESVHREHGDQLAVFALNLGLNDSVEAVRKVQADHSLTVPVAIDREGALARLFRVSVTPQHVLIDRAGVIRHVGHHADAELDRAIETVLAADAGPAPSPAAHSDESGEELALELRDGSTFRLADAVGKPVALTFLSTWADWYLAETRPAMAGSAVTHAQQLEKLKGAYPEVVWVSVASPVWTSASDVEEYLQRLGATGPIGIDEDWTWFGRYKVSEVPTTVVLGRDGAEVARQTGGTGLAEALAHVR